MDMSLSKLHELIMDRDVMKSMGLQRVGLNWVTEMITGDWDCSLLPETTLSVSQVDFS